MECRCVRWFRNIWRINILTKVLSGRADRYYSSPDIGTGAKSERGFTMVRCLWLILLIPACGPDKHLTKPVASYYIHPVLEPYLLEFKRDAEAYQKPLEFRLTRLDFSFFPEPKVGECRVYRGGRQILVDPTITGIEFKSLLYHEFGHCLLGLDHSDGLMAPFLLPESYLESSWGELVKSLFNKTTGESNGQ